MAENLLTFYSVINENLVVF